MIAYHYLSLEILPVIGRIFGQCYDLFRKRLKSHFVRSLHLTSHSKMYIYAFTPPIVCPPVAAKRTTSRIVLFLLSHNIYVSVFQLLKRGVWLQRHKTAVGTG